jgi:hypothetical protein
MRAPLALALLLVSAVCLAQAPASLGLGSPAPAPAIHFEKAHHDFGEILESGPRVSCSYGVSNRGQLALRIREVRAGCGCSSVSVGRRELAPGEGTTIEVRFDPKGLSGNVHKTLEVLSNDPAEPSARLTFEATVMAGIMPSATGVFFRGVRRDAKASASVRLRSTDGRPVEVAACNIPNAPCLSCAHSRDGDDAILDVTIDGGLIPRFSYNGADVLTVLTKSPKYPKFEFKVRWDVPAPVTAEPSRVTLQGAAGGEACATVVVSSGDGAAFRILRAVPSSPLMGVEGLGRDSAASHTFEVIFSGRARPGGYHEKLELRLDHPEQRTLEITVAAVVRPQ